MSGVKTKRGSMVRARSSRREGDDATLSAHGYPGTAHREHTRVPPEINDTGWVTIDLQRVAMEIWAGISIADAEKFHKELGEAIAHAKEHKPCDDRCYWCKPRTP